MKNLILFIAAFLIYQSARAQDYYQQSIDDTTLAGEQIFLHKILPAPNDNFLIAGTEQWEVGSETKYAIIVLLVDSNGNMLWNKIYKYGLNVKFREIALFTGGFYLLGRTDNNLSILVKLDMEGNLIEGNAISTADYYMDITNMVAWDGGILLSGEDGLLNVFLFKRDSAGNFTTFPHYTFDTGFSVTGILTVDAGFYLYGWMYNGGGYGDLKNGIISRFNGAGDLLWAKKFKLDGGYGRTFARAGSINEDHTLNLVYDASDLFDYYTKIGLCRIDSNGNFLLEKEFATELDLPVVITGMSLSQEKEITIYGGSSPLGMHDTTVLFRVDEDFNLLWAKSFDHIYNGDPYSSSEGEEGIAEVGGGNLIVSGYDYQAQRGIIKKITPDGLGCNAKDFFMEDFNKSLTILELNNFSSESFSLTLTPGSFGVSSSLVSYSGCDTLATAIIEPYSSSYQFFPNPFNHSFNLITNANSEISIYDVAGRLLESHKNATGEFSGGEQLAPGIYFIEIKTSSGDREMMKVVRVE